MATWERVQVMLGSTGLPSPEVVRGKEGHDRWEAQQGFLDVKGGRGVAGAVSGECSVAAG